jgi:predicted ester cyclase
MDLVFKLKMFKELPVSQTRSAVFKQIIAQRSSILITSAFDTLRRDVLVGLFNDGEKVKFCELYTILITRP